MDPCQPQKGWTLALVRTLWFSVRKSERTPAGQLLGVRETGSETMKALSRLARFAAISAAAGILAFGLVQSVQAEDKELVIAYHADLPSWDPSLNFPEGQAIFKTVFDAPLMQERSLKIIPARDLGMGVCRRRSPGRCGSPSATTSPSTTATS